MFEPGAEPEAASESSGALRSGALVGVAVEGAVGADMLRDEADDGGWRRTEMRHAWEEGKMAGSPEKASFSWSRGSSKHHARHSLGGEQFSLRTIHIFILTAAAGSSGSSLLSALSSPAVSPSSPPEGRLPSKEGALTHLSREVKILGKQGQDR